MREEVKTPALQFLDSLKHFKYPGILVTDDKGIELMREIGRTEAQIDNHRGAIISGRLDPTLVISRHESIIGLSNKLLGIHDQLFELIWGPMTIAYGPITLNDIHEEGFYQGVIITVKKVYLARITDERR